MSFIYWVDHSYTKPHYSNLSVVKKSFGSFGVQRNLYSSEDRQPILLLYADEIAGSCGLHWYI